MPAVMFSDARHLVEVSSVSLAEGVLVARGVGGEHGGGEQVGGLGAVDAGQQVQGVDGGASACLGPGLVVVEAGFS